jgi:hypothetical protein
MSRRWAVLALLLGPGCYDFNAALETCVANRFCVDADGGVSSSDAGRGDAGGADAGVPGLPVGAVCSSSGACATGRCEAGRCVTWAFPLGGVIAGSMVSTPDSRAVLFGGFGQSIDLGTGPKTFAALGQGFVSRRASDGASSTEKVAVPAAALARARVEAVAVDDDGSLAVVGLNASSLEVDGVLARPPFQGGAADVFVARLEPATDTVRWLASIGGPNDEANPAVAVDRSGNVYVVGWTNSETITLNTCAGGCPMSFRTGITQPGLQAWHSFVVKLSGATGLPAWVRFQGSDSFTGPRAIAWSAFDDSIIIGGGFILTLRLDSDRADGGVVRSTAVGEDAYLMKLKADDGEATWTRIFGGGSNEAVTGVVVDRDGGVYASGLFFANPTEQLAPLTTPPTSALSPFVLKLTAQNQPVWLRVLQSQAPQVNRARDPQPLTGLYDHLGIALAPSGALVLSGWTSRTLSLNGQVFVRVPDGGAPQQYLLPLSTDNVPSLDKALQFQSTDRAAVFPALAPNGNLFLSGVFTGSLELPLDGGVLASGDAGVRAGFAASLGRWPQ